MVTTTHRINLLFFSFVKKKTLIFSVVAKRMTFATNWESLITQYTKMLYCHCKISAIHT